MCLAAFALEAHPRFPLVIAANRDEFFARAASPMAWWRSGGIELLAGRDLSAGGTWFGLTRAGRLALLTNIREPGRNDPEAPSRGALVVDWLASGLAAPAFATAMKPGYNGFNLVTADLARNAWHWISNRTAGAQPLAGGIHGLSNAALDTPWPKTVGIKAELAAALAAAVVALAAAAGAVEQREQRGQADHEQRDAQFGGCRPEREAFPVQEHGEQQPEPADHAPREPVLAERASRAVCGFGKGVVRRRDMQRGDDERRNHRGDDPHDPGVVITAGVEVAARPAHPRGQRVVDQVAARQRFELFDQQREQDGEETHARR